MTLYIDTGNVAATLAHWRVSQRQQRLFACACVRLVWKYLEDERSKQAVEAAEGFAEGIVTVKELNEARKRACEVIKRYDHYSGNPKRTVATMAHDCTSSYIAVAVHSTSWELNHWWTHGMQKRLRQLLAHYTKISSTKITFPATVTKLAESLYSGEDCSFALRDALLESGFPTFAGHFHVEHHPKGCRRLDLILGKR